MTKDCEVVGAYVMVGSGAFTSMLMVVEILPPALDAVTVTGVKPWTVEGVPLISPVALMINKPLGSVEEVYAILEPVIVGLAMTASTPWIKLTGEE
jgi:hypothetical protein